MSRTLPEWVWSRHANPASGWSRVPGGAALVAAVYRRDARLFALVVLWTVLNPVVFPATDDESSWMARGVRGEQAWLADGNPAFGWEYPELCNTLNVPVFAGALYAAYRRRPREAALLTALSYALKFAFVAEMVRYLGER